MQYPSLRDYQNAIVNQNNFNIPFFQSESMEIFLNPRGYPFMFVGGFGAIFKFRDKDKREYAFKVFTRDVADRGERYQALHDTLQKAQLPFMADFHYVPEGLRVKGEPYPAVVMEWGRGIQLDKAIEYDLADDGILQCAPFLAGELFAIVKTLQERGMGHNDLQEGNILVRDDNKLVLIDYDGMFVPQLANWPPCELGLPNFQHPLRDKTHFNAKIDDFALISILYQLAVITPDLWEKHHDDRRLLLKAVDYKYPGQSELIRNGLQSKEKHVRALGQLLTDACDTDPLKINAVEKISANPSITGWLIMYGKPVSAFEAESAIQWALALKNEDLAEYEADRLKHTDSTVTEIKAVKHRKEASGRWKALRSYMEASRAARQKEDVAQVEKETTQAKTTASKPHFRLQQSSVTRPNKMPPAPAKQTLGAGLVTFIVLLFKLVWKYTKSSNVLKTIVTIMLMLMPFCLFRFFLKYEPVPVSQIKFRAVPEKMMNGEPYLINSLGMEFVYIPPGEFGMGSPVYESGRESDEKWHRVILTKGFYLQTTEVTQGQWQGVMGSNPSSFKKCGKDCPVERITWYDARKFIDKLNKRTEKYKYLMPTEAEWEYACRAGTKTPFAFGKCLSTDHANYNGQHPLAGCVNGKYRKKTVPVASFIPNVWGLYDMHGNVWEWCYDEWYYYEDDANNVRDPLHIFGGFEHIMRGGSWRSGGMYIRSANRDFASSDECFNDTGLRISVKPLGRGS